MADQLPEVGQQLFAEGDDVVLVDEAHLDVKLGELGLPVGPEVLVAVAAGDLVITLHAGHHQQLLEQLRTLRQGVPGAGPQPGGNQEVPGALRGRAGHRRGLDLDELVVGEGFASHPVHRAAQSDRLGRGRSAQIEVAVLEPGLLADLGPFIDLERQRRGRVEHLELGGHHLDLAGGKVGIGVALRTQRDLAGDQDAVLVAQFVGTGGVQDLVPDYHLSHAGGVPQIQKGDAAMITSAGHPARQRHGCSGVLGTKSAGLMAANHCCPSSVGPDGREPRSTDASSVRSYEGRGSQAQPVSVR